MTERISEGEQLRLVEQEAAIITLLRANHASFVALQPMVVELLESGRANQADVEAIYEVCGDAWNLLNAIHDAAQQSLPELTEDEPLHIEPTSHDEAEIVSPKPDIKLVTSIPEPAPKQPDPDTEQRALTAYATSLAIPTDFDEQVAGLLDRYNGCVNVVAVVRQVLHTERLSSAAFNELCQLLKNEFGLEHTGKGFYRRPTDPTEQSVPANHNSNLDSQIQQAIGRGSVPIWKPKQRGRYSKS